MDRSGWVLQCSWLLTRVSTVGVCVGGRAGFLGRSSVFGGIVFWENFPLEAGGSDSLRRQGATSDREDIESKGSKVEGPAISSGDFRGGCDEVSVFKVLPVFWDKRPVAHSGSSRAMSNTSYCPELGGL